MAPVDRDVVQPSLELDLGHPIGGPAAERARDVGTTGRLGDDRPQTSSSRLKRERSGDRRPADATLAGDDK